MKVLPSLFFRGLCFLTITSPALAGVVDPGTGEPDAADAGLKLWLDATDAGTLFQDVDGLVPAVAGQPVARWDDKSLSGIVVSQASAANTPTLAAAVPELNNSPAVSFVGGSDGDALTSTTGNSTGISGAAPMTVVTVWKTTGFTGQNYQHTFHMGNPTGAQAYGHSVSRDGGGGEISNHYWGDGYNSGGRVAAGESAIAISTYDGATDNWYVNGLFIGQRNVALNVGADQLQVGSRLSPFTEGFTGDLAEVIVFDTVLTTEEQIALTSYLSQKYAIQISEFPEGPGPGGVSLTTGRPVPSHPALKLWLDAGDLGTLWQDTDGTIPAADGQPVARWDDKSGSGIIVAQADPANAPSLTAGVAELNSVPAVTFVGGAGGDALTSTTGNSTGVSGLAELTMVTVWKNTGYTGQNYQHTIHMGDPSCLSAYGHSTSRAGNAGSGIGNHYWCDGFDNTGATANGDANMALSTYDRSTDTWYINGAPGGTRTVFVTIGSSELQIGSRLQPFVEGFTGHLAEVILFCTVLTEEERNALGFYIQQKYGIQVQGAALAGSLRILGVNYEEAQGVATVRLRFTSRLGGSYKIEASPDLMNWENELDDAFAGQGEMSEFVHVIGPASSAPRLYYRVTEN